MAHKRMKLKIPTRGPDGKEWRHSSFRLLLPYEEVDKANGDICWSIIGEEWRSNDMVGFFARPKKQAKFVLATSWMTE